MTIMAFVCYKTNLTEYAANNAVLEAVFQGDRKVYSSIIGAKNGHENVNMIVSKNDIESIASGKELISYPYCS